MKDTKVRWLQDFRRFLPLKSQFVLSGNIKDLQLTKNEFGSYGWHKLENAIDLELKSLGYTHVIYYNPLNGFDIPFFSDDPEEKKVLFQAKFTKNALNGLPNRNRLTICLWVRAIN